MYTRDISDNLKPEDFQDLKIIKKGEGAKFIKETLLSDGQNKELKSSIDYHKEFLDSAGDRVVANDFDYLNGTHSQALFKASKFGAAPVPSLPEHGGEKQNLNQTMQTAATLEPQAGLDSAPGPQPAASIVQEALPPASRLQSNSNITILGSQQRVDLAKSLHLPEDLWPVWKVENPLYDIYYIPGYDNWLYERVKHDPAQLHRISDYKRAYFENLLRVQNPELFELYLRDKREKPDPLPNIYGSGLHQTLAVGQGSSLLPGVNPYTGRGQINTSGHHPAKREHFNRDGLLVSTQPEQKLATGTEFWQTTYQNANQLSGVGDRAAQNLATDKKSWMSQTQYGKEAKYSPVTLGNGTIRLNAAQE